MANEIKFKVKLTKEKVIEFFNKRNCKNNYMKGDILYDCFYVKDDYYYKTLNNDDVIRIREEDKHVISILKEDTNPFEYCDKSNTLSNHKYLIYKKKSIIDENEINEEFETPIHSKVVFDKIMESLGVEQYFHKNKKSVRIGNQFADEFVDYGIRYNIDLVCVNDKYYYLEAEYIGIIGEDKKIKTASDAIKFLETRKIIIENFDVSVKDPRSWIEIVGPNEN